MKILNLILILFLVSCSKSSSQISDVQQVINTSKEKDSLEIISQLILKEYRVLTNNSEEIIYSFNQNKPHKWEIYEDFFYNKKGKYYIEKGIHHDINNDGIEDLILIVNDKKVIGDNYKPFLKIQEKASSFKDSILSKIQNTEYFSKNEAENYYQLKDKINTIIPIHFIILLGESNDKYSLELDNYKIIPSYKGYKDSYNYSLSINKNGIYINTDDYYEQINPEKKSEMGLMFIYNEEKKDWILEKAHIHFWSDHDIDIDDYCELTPKDFGTMTLKNFDYNNMYKAKARCYKEYY